MPGSNTGHLPQTLVSLPGKLLCVPTAAATPGNTDDINHLVLVEDSRHRHGLLQMLLGPLHLRDVSFFLFQRQLLAHLRLFLPSLILPLLTVFGEGLLFPNGPVFVESALALVTEATDGLNVSHHPHHHDRRSVNDGNSLHLLTAGHLPEGVGHASLVSQEGSEKSHVPMAWCMEFAM
uniref:Uncharacterized protein n=1 Tax=Cynoglossus semilaevis TaxID=244447 RepID=A0A3P8WG74_CYNSE